MPVTVADRTIPCPECGGTLRLRDSRYGLFYGCDNYPRCDCKHGAHKATGEPLGTPATKRVREARIRAHAAFDVLWKSGRMKRSAAYRWLTAAMGREASEGVHIGSLDEVGCDLVVDVVSKLTSKKP